MKHRPFLLCAGFAIAFGGCNVKSTHTIIMEDAGSADSGSAAEGEAVSYQPDLDDACAGIDTQGDPLALDAARCYLVEKINEHRKAAGLGTVVLDLTASTAGDEHAADMCAYGYVSDWDREGRLPDQRYFAAGGKHKVQENASGYSDGVVRELESSPVFLKEALNAVDEQWFNEIPPNDGHKLNILNPAHNKAGIGLSQAKEAADHVCATQEFVNAYATMGKLPASAKVGGEITIKGAFNPDYQMWYIAFARSGQPAAMTLEQLDATAMYVPPAPYIWYRESKWETARPIIVTGNQFELTAPLDDGGQTGIYWITVGLTKDEQHAIDVSTLLVEAGTE